MQHWISGYRIVSRLGLECVGILSANFGSGFDGRFRPRQRYRRTEALLPCPPCPLSGLLLHSLNCKPVKADSSAGGHYSRRVTHVLRKNETVSRVLNDPGVKLMIDAASAAMVTGFLTLVVTKIDKYWGHRYIVLPMTAVGYLESTRHVGPVRSAVVGES